MTEDNNYKVPWGIRSVSTLLEKNNKLLHQILEQLRHMEVPKVRIKPINEPTWEIAEPDTNTDPFDEDGFWMYNGGSD